ncbi:MAG: efflux RND transporter periplasmic adaptor subunit [Planctomycetota bacterium]
MRNSPRSRWSTPILALAIVAGLAGGAWVLKPDADGSQSDRPTYTVRTGPLTIAVNETGTIRSADRRTLKSEVEGQRAITWIIDEGSIVEPGELLVELDSSELENDRTERAIRVQNAEAAFVRAQEELEVVKSQNRSNISRAELDLQFAKEDLQKYIEGDYPRELMAAEADVTLAEEELRRATDKFQWSRRLYDEKYLSETEFLADELEMKRAELTVSVRRETLKVLTDFTRRRQVTQLQSDIEQAQLSLERVQRVARADLVKAEADLRWRDNEFQEQKDRLTKIEDQIGKTKILAPAPGMVVYATSAGNRWGGDQEPLDEGKLVRHREELIYLPTADSMAIELKIHESSLGKLAVGLPADVKIDSMPDLVLQGRVQRIAPLPDATSVWLNPDLKVFSTTVALEGDLPELRTGMSGTATILVEHFDEALAVPVQAVTRVRGQPIVHVVDEGGQATPREVQLGADNSSMVQIVSGLQDGETVLLTPPLGGGTNGEAPQRGPRQDEVAGITPRGQQMHRAGGQSRGDRTQARGASTAQAGTR